MAAFYRFSVATALAASLAMAASPIAASAAEAPQVAHPAGYEVLNHDAGTVEGWGYRGYRGYRRGPDAGDVIAGVVVLGTIAAIASAASRNNRDRDYRYRDYPNRDYRTRDYRDRDYRYDDRREDRTRSGAEYGASGLQNAVNMCVDQVERGSTRVDTVDQANRTGDGWQVAGRTAAGDSFSCRIDNDGRIRDVDVGRGYEGADYDGASYAQPAGEPGERQLDDSTYARARAAQGGAPASYRYRDAAAAPQAEAQGPQPAYPGGPLPGEDVASDDGRYSTASAPDFGQSS